MWRGPAYYWLEDSTMVERSHLTATGRQTWGYDPEGRIMQYSFSEPRQRRSWLSCEKPSKRFGDEWYDEDGNLVGFGINNQFFYWKGALKTNEEYLRLMQEWHPWRQPRDSTRLP